MSSRLRANLAAELKLSSRVGSDFVDRQAIISVIESSQVGEVRRTAARFAGLAGLDETAQGKVAIIATELATNLVRHAKDGRILIQVMQTPYGSSVEILSVDSGPGVSDVDRCLQDGFSTGGSSGTGLGAVRRLSTEFDIYSVPLAGTIVLSRTGTNDRQSHSTAAIAIGAISIAMPGETECGDSWKYYEAEHEIRLMIADGLGHGLLAAEAANAADEVFDAQPATDPKSLLEAIHRALSGTRGAAIAVAHLDLRSGLLKYAGAGNIAGSFLTSQGSQGLVSHNGIVGVKLHKVQQFEYSAGEGGLLIMHSDGLRTRWTLNDHPGLAVRHPALIAGLMYRDYLRGRDDATVVVVRFGLNKA